MDDDVFEALSAFVDRVLESSKDVVDASIEAYGVVASAWVAHYLHKTEKLRVIRALRAALDVSNEANRALIALAEEAFDYAKDNITFTVVSGIADDGFRFRHKGLSFHLKEDKELEGRDMTVSQLLLALDRGTKNIPPMRIIYRVEQALEAATPTLSVLGAPLFAVRVQNLRS